MLYEVITNDGGGVGGTCAGAHSWRTRVGYVRSGWRVPKISPAASATLAIRDTVHRPFVPTFVIVITSYSIHYTKLYDDQNSQQEGADQNQDVTLRPPEQLVV